MMSPLLPPVVWSEKVFAHVFEKCNQPFRRMYLAGSVPLLSQSHAARAYFTRTALKPYVVLVEPLEVDRPHVFYGAL